MWAGDAPRADAGLANYGDDETSTGSATRCELLGKEAAVLVLTLLARDLAAVLALLANSGGGRAGAPTARTSCPDEATG